MPVSEIVPTSESGFNAGLRDSLVDFLLEQGVEGPTKFADDVIAKYVEKQNDLKNQQVVCVPYQRYTYRLLGDCLDRLGLELKYDIIDEHFEIILKEDFDSPISDWFRDHLQPGKSVRLTERLETTLFQEITLFVRFNQKNKNTKQLKEIEFIPKHQKASLMAYSIGVEFNPIINWIRSGPDWDGIPRLLTFYQKYFNAKVDGDKKALVEFAGLVSFVGPIQRNLHPGCQQDWMIVLTGPQGIQKSSFIRALQPPGMDVFSDSPDLRMDPKKLYESTDGCVFVELNEMKGLHDTERLRTRESQREILKDYISSRTDRRRIPYARKSVTRPRYLTLFGTSNKKRCVPYDPSGYRRFIVLELQVKPGNGIESQMQSLVDKNDKNKGTLQQQLYAEAMYLFDEYGGKDFLYEVSEENDIEQLQHKVNAIEYSIGSLEATKLLEESDDSEFEGRSPSEVAVEYGCNTKQVSAVLHKRGFQTFQKTINGKTARRFHKSVQDAQFWAEQNRRVQYH